MISLTDSNFLIDGRPITILSGEVHYFRLPKHAWRPTLEALKATGMNTVSTYIPWLIHEEIEGQYDFSGKQHAENDLISFIELVQAMDLYLIARPGPFVMAELKNEGIPYWVREKYPEAISRTWNAQSVMTGTLDYSHPGFQQETRHWFQKVSGVLKPYLQPNGGPIIGVQLDNEVGMLSWVSNSPDITPTTSRLFANWLVNNYGDQLPMVYPKAIVDPIQALGLMAKPTDDYVLQLEYDLGYFNRIRFKDYINNLIDAAKSAGLSDVPYFINVHGTDQERGETFPIGISQLYDLFQLKDVLIGTDIYFGDFTMMSATHLYTLNRFMQAVDGHWPLSTLEFNASSGNNTDHVPLETDASALALKTRLQVAQGTKVINNYLFRGGYNRKLAVPVNDGNSRVGIHGWRHGFGSLLNPEGVPASSLPTIKDVTQKLNHLQTLMGDLRADNLPIKVGFYPDLFMTESVYPNSQLAQAQADNQAINRAQRPWNSLLRALLATKLNYDAYDIQSQSLDINKVPVLIMATGKAMHELCQKKLVAYVKAGGRLILTGELPIQNLVGQPATQLIDYLGVRPEPVKTERWDYFPTIIGENFLEGVPEVRVTFLQSFAVTNGTVFWRELMTRQPVGAFIRRDHGEAAILGADWRFEPMFYLKLLAHFGIKPQFELLPRQSQILVLATGGCFGNFIHILNTDNSETQFKISDLTGSLFNDQWIHVPAKDGLILPTDVQYFDWQLDFATVELSAIDKQQLVFDVHHVDSVIQLTITDGQFLPSQAAWAEIKGETMSIHPKAVGRLVVERQGQIVYSN
ncbi:beta-galactosidase [Lactobacillus sp.] [Lactiplantibacillus mudanjiangensis]|uniref:beta-galactosidase n=1 Tax=Lactiplantibacillus mudanjiangensis TaxID=1296538 RepID=UPI0010150080|nr:beta-galactosidase [Lactiplantibacillus mudanjiangensis]VDG32065.1 beta-galactosidase [Lactobacillus sp.] [Lactiplantibacillus mudanjiangensis]